MSCDRCELGDCDCCESCDRCEVGDCDCCPGIRDWNGVCDVCGMIGKKGQDKYGQQVTPKPEQEEEP
jgi:hypothetical protein